MFKKWLAWLLCLSVMLSLCACGGENPAESTEPSQTESTTTEPVTESQEELLTSFQTAKEALLSVDYLTLSIKGEDSRSVMQETPRFRKESTTAKYSGLQGDLLASVSSEYTFGYGEMETSKYFYAEDFVGGTVYATYKDAKYREEISAEDFLACQVPLCLFDADNFGKVTLEGGAVLHFTDAVALESWIAPDYAELISAEATATVVENAITKMTYEAIFRQGAADVSVSYEVSVNTATEVKLSAEAPADADSRNTINHANLLPIIDQCYYNALMAKAKTVEIAQLVTSQAAGIALQTVTTVGEYGPSENEYYGRIHKKITQFTQEGQESVETEDIFNDGKYSFYYDGELSDEQDMGTTIFKDAIFNTMAEYLIFGNEITEATITQVDDGYLVEYETERQDVLDRFKETTTLEIFQDSTVLDNASTAYEQKAISGFIGMDMDCLRIRSFSADFQGTHTIDGGNYLLSQQITYAYDAPNFDVYKEVTGETLPETEPAEKASPLFYHVTGENGEEMWLLGTIHIGDERTGFLPEEIYAAFDASDALAVEFDINAAMEALEEDEDMAQKMAALMVYTDGTTAGDYLYTDTYEAAMRHLKYSGNYSAGVEMMKISIWQNSIATAMLQGHRSLTVSKGVDQRLLDRAEAAGKEILNVESMESQMKMLTGFSNELQELLLKQTLASTRHEAVAETEALYELWCAGDEAAIRESLKEAFEGDDALVQEYEQAISTNRDKGMVESAKSYLTSGKTVFYAVGLAHLLADNGLVDSLRAAGYTVELVSYAN